MGKELFFFIAGFILVILFFATAPRSPVYQFIGIEYRGLVSSIGFAAGVVGLISIVSGYTLYLLKTKPKRYVYLNIGLLTALFIWLSASYIINRYIFREYELSNLLLSMTIVLPIILVPYYLMVKRLYSRNY